MKDDSYEKEIVKVCKDLLFEHYKVRDSVPEGDREEGQTTIFTQLISLNEISKFAEDIASTISKIPCPKCKELEDTTTGFQEQIGDLEKIIIKEIDKNNKLKSKIERLKGKRVSYKDVKLSIENSPNRKE